jgi:integrase
MQRGLTARAVETMRAGAARRELPDRYLPGLYLIVQPSGRKVWCVRYRHGGRTRKLTIGAYPLFDLKAAREAGAKALRTVAEGRDPGDEREAARTATSRSIEAVAAQFIDQHCKRHCRPLTIGHAERALKLHVLPRWRGRTLDSISRRDVVDMLDRIVDNGAPVAANRALAVVRKLFNWAVARDMITVSPCIGVKRPAAEQARDRVLTDAELGNVWRAADKLAGPFGAQVKLLMLAGQRRSEVAGMTWAEIDLEGRLWTLPKERAKNNRAHTVPLSLQALAVIEAAPRITGSHLVFTNNGKVAARNYSDGMRQLRNRLPPDMPHWQLHDLRRTCASGMARLGINLPVIERVLNHTSGSFAGIVGVYQKHSFADEKRAALEQWGDFIERLVGKR